MSVNILNLFPSLMLLLYIDYSKIQTINE
jgi:hypothetical protein